MSELQDKFDELIAHGGDTKKPWEISSTNKSTDKNHITSQVVELILAQAIVERASDIHIEPDLSGLRVRYRIDGELYETLSFKDPDIMVLQRIKIMAQLPTDTMAKRKSQYGRFSQKIGEIGRASCRERVLVQV